MFWQNSGNLACWDDFDFEQKTPKNTCFDKILEIQHGGDDSDFEQKTPKMSKKLQKTHYFEQKTPKMSKKLPKTHFLDFFQLFLNSFFSAKNKKSTYFQCSSCFSLSFFNPISKKT